ncbi:uncharacterized protein HMPREF1541_08731 [Cyphellophora europaea CBS 101466]|uniref:ER-bound oxygenase mpaB/mpaB'/Rubber oxygenase catalytic domain-containing protein n=1 Tax=Cyphellophora europaea (strain CBS 101466) TaxID=1220924 RepID=W2RL77_CYPE1|nr:uncharacterized protein HMPREF1541_08731 [Cyphellophora europaea CBS 101466]ETN36453.1 hypothetical protein HMPREF1541_08731 [Cyphellophora europaea CBS 101466]
MANLTSITAALPFVGSKATPHLIPALPPLQAVFPYLVALIPVHLLLVRLFRYHTVRRLYRNHPFSSRPNALQRQIAELPLSAAHDIVRKISGTEFVYMFNLGLQFALIRTYAIPSISHLLVATAQLSNRQINTVGKRYADTTALVYEIYHNLPGTTRSSSAFARLNYLHGHYLRQGKISNDDMLYTLSLFMNSPPEWIARLEWRELTELELAGQGLYHRFMGEAMDISYAALDDIRPAPLPGMDAAAAEQRNWRDDGLAFYSALDQWSKAYEARVMLPHEDNYKTAVRTLELLNSVYPRFMHGVISKAFVALMDERMRIACMFPPSPPSYKQFFEGAFKVRAWLIRHLFLPRRSLWGWWVPEDERGLVTEYTSTDGRRWFTMYDALPHYVKPTLWNRWGPSGWLSLAMGVPRPGDDEMYGEGWKVDEIGPERFAKKGQKEFEVTRKSLEGRVETERGVYGGDASVGGCPFFVKI